MFHRSSPKPDLMTHYTPCPAYPTCTFEHLVAGNSDAVSVGHINIVDDSMRRRSTHLKLIFVKEGVNRVPGTLYKLTHIWLKIKRHKTLLWSNKDKLPWKWNKNPLSTPTIRRWCSDTLRRRNCEIRFVVSTFLIVTNLKWNLFRWYKVDF